MRFHMGSRACIACRYGGQGECWPGILPMALGPPLRREDRARRSTRWKAGCVHCNRACTPLTAGRAAAQLNKASASSGTYVGALLMLTATSELVCRIVNLHMDVRLPQDHHLPCTPMRPALHCA